MTRSFRFFLITFVLSLPFWWGINSLQAGLTEVFYYRQFEHNDRIMAARLSQLEFEERIKTLYPLRNPEAADLTVNARSAISLLINDIGREKLLLQKNIDQKLPIASLTKLMTAYVVVEHYDLAKEIKISKEAVQQEESLGKLKVGDVLSVETLLYPLLMESSNDAAFALAHDYDGMNQGVFVGLMNSEAEKLGLENTFFSNVTGLDSEVPGVATNYSTAYDLTKLVGAILEKPLLLDIMATPQINLYGSTLVNSNQLLGWKFVLGGKTGYTEEALGCFVLFLEAPADHRYLINVILGTDNGRFSEMEKIINWVNTAYQW